MDEDETTRILNVVLGRLDEQSAMLQGMRLELGEVKGDLAGLKNEVVGLKTDVTGLKDEVAGLRTEFQAFRQEAERRFDGIDGKLDWLAAKVMEHDQAIFQLKRKQA